MLYINIYIYEYTRIYVIFAKQFYMNYQNKIDQS